MSECSRKIQNSLFVFERHLLDTLDSGAAGQDQRLRFDRESNIDMDRFMGLPFDVGGEAGDKAFQGWARIEANKYILDGFIWRCNFYIDRLASNRVKGGLPVRLL